MKRSELLLREHCTVGWFDMPFYVLAEVLSREELVLPADCPLQAKHAEMIIYVASKLALLPVTMHSSLKLLEGYWALQKSTQIEKMPERPSDSVLKKRRKRISRMYSMLIYIDQGARCVYLYSKLRSLYVAAILY